LAREGHLPRVAGGAGWPVIQIDDVLPPLIHEGRNGPVVEVVQPTANQTVSVIPLGCSPSSASDMKRWA
jgi:hypothetical protein